MHVKVSDRTASLWYSGLMSTTYSTIPHQQRIEKPWGWESLYTPEGSRWTGKILFVQAGKRLSFQYHDEKEEVLCLVSGSAQVWLEDGSGEIQKVSMELMKGYHVQINQKHRIEAVDDSMIVEVSDPEKGNTFRIEDDFARNTETEDMRAEDNRGWSAGEK